MDRTKTYDIIYALAALNGREGALFGRCAPLAHEAFCHSLPCDAFPELWFEVPLAGDSWFDLHALTAREDLTPGMTFTPDETGGYPEIFEWFARADGVRQLALSYDVSSGSIEHPAAQLLMSGSDVSVACEFLKAAGRSDALEAYRTFHESLPEGWYLCYVGTFPSRSNFSLRVECIPAYEQQRAYANDGALLESHLRQVGFTQFDNTLIERCQILARSPFMLEFQFDVMPDGRAGTTLGASVRFAAPSSREVGWRPFYDAGDLMRQVQDWGLADDRWRLLGQTAFTKRMEVGGEATLIYSYPAFLKLRWRDGDPLDAKAYLIAGTQSAE